MMSKRYLKGGLMRRRSLILGLSMRAVNRSAVGFQKSPINNSKMYIQFKSEGGLIVQEARVGCEDWLYKFIVDE